MFEDFIIRALIAGIAVALISGMIGCFVIWRRMAYFGDSLSHSALLGVVLGIATGFNMNLSIIIICLIFSLLMMFLSQNKMLTTDSILGILAHATLSISIVISYLMGQQLNLHAYLFGDILTVTTHEIYWIYGGGIIAILLLIINWQALVLMTIHEELAKAENVNVFYTHLLFMFLITIIVSISIRIVGILLITSMLIIPTATARQLAYSPISMAIIASVIGVIAIIMGIFGSIQFDTPSGPTIIIALVILFACTLMTTSIKQLFNSKE